MFDPHDNEKCVIIAISSYKRPMVCTRSGFSTLSVKWILAVDLLGLYFPQANPPLPSWESSFMPTFLPSLVLYYTTQTEEKPIKDAFVLLWKVSLKPYISRLCVIYKSKCHQPITGLRGRCGWNHHHHHFFLMRHLINVATKKSWRMNYLLAFYFSLKKKRDPGRFEPLTLSF